MFTTLSTLFTNRIVFFMSNKKKIHEISQVDHLGLHLARVYNTFKQEMLRGLRSLGFTELTSQHLLILPSVKADGIKTVELIERTGIQKQALSRSLKEMVAADLIELDPDPDDKRAKIVRLGQKAYELIDASKPLKLAFHKRVSDTIGKETLDDFIEMLKSIEHEFAE